MICRLGRSTAWVCHRPMCHANANKTPSSKHSSAISHLVSACEVCVVTPSSLPPCTSATPCHSGAMQEVLACVMAATDMNCRFFWLNSLFLSWFRSDHGPNAWMPSVTIWWAENIWMEANTLNARLVGKTSPLRNRQWHTRHVCRTLLFRCLNRQADAEMTWCRFGCPLRRLGIPNNASKVMGGQQCHWWRLER